MRRLYEYRPIGRLGLLGSLALGLVLGIAAFVSPTAPDGIEAHLIETAAFAVAGFLFVFAIGQHLYWAIEDGGISWRGPTLRRHSVSWDSLAQVDVVWRGRGSFRGRALKLVRRNGTAVLVRQSKRHAGSLGPEALELLEVFAAQHGFEVGWAEPEPEPVEPRVEEPAPLPGQSSLF
jgi:hypothetical protein